MVLDLSFLTNDEILHLQSVLNREKAFYNKINRTRVVWSRISSDDVIRTEFSNKKRVPFVPASQIVLNALKEIPYRDDEKLSKSISHTICSNQLLNEEVDKQSEDDKNPAEEMPCNDDTHDAIKLPYTPAAVEEGNVKVTSNVDMVCPAREVNEIELQDIEVGQESFAYCAKPGIQQGVSDGNPTPTKVKPKSVTPTKPLFESATVSNILWCLPKPVTTKLSTAEKHIPPKVMMYDMTTTPPKSNSRKPSSAVLDFTNEKHVPDVIKPTKCNFNQYSPESSISTPNTKHSKSPKKSQNSRRSSSKSTPEKPSTPQKYSPISATAVSPVQSNQLNSSPTWSSPSEAASEVFFAAEDSPFARGTSVKNEFSSSYQRSRTAPKRMSSLQFTFGETLSQGDTFSSQFEDEPKIFSSEQETSFKSQEDDSRSLGSVSVIQDGCAGELIVSLTYYPANSMYKRTQCPLKGTRNPEDPNTDVISRRSYVTSTGSRLPVHRLSESGAAEADDSELRLKIVGANQLKLPGHIKRNKSKTYVKCYMLPDKSHRSKMRSTIIKSTNSPRYNHNFVFRGFNKSELMERCIEIMVVGVGSAGSRRKSNTVGGIRLSSGERKHIGKPAEWMDSNAEERELWMKSLSAPGMETISIIPLRSHIKPTYK
uniref:uncharacterized protein LOC104265437 isoform X2 n=1 Tax=Ciona intestinalis TaxID=7719 RepID=UPI00089DB48C|nr:uncharacterized protein LOC104265437 isoform X2 [Ciona intestinalis]|eukprot:XP_026696697.1 uncharacterized protein LOC104265437 isoform X2 [Ciona intestinalis]